MYRRQPILQTLRRSLVNPALDVVDGATAVSKEQPEILPPPSKALATDDEEAPPPSLTRERLAHKESDHEPLATTLAPQAPSPKKEIVLTSARDGNLFSEAIQRAYEEDNHDAIGVSQGSDDDDNSRGSGLAVRKIIKAAAKPNDQDSVSDECDDDKDLHNQNPSHHLSQDVLRAHQESYSPQSSAGDVKPHSPGAATPKSIAVKLIQAFIDLSLGLPKKAIQPGPYVTPLTDHRTTDGDDDVAASKEPTQSPPPSEALATVDKGCYEVAVAPRDLPHPTAPVSHPKHKKPPKIDPINWAAIKSKYNKIQNNDQKDRSCSSIDSSDSSIDSSDDDESQAPAPICAAATSKEHAQEPIKTDEMKPLGDSHGHDSDHDLV